MQKSIRTTELEQDLAPEAWCKRTKQVIVFSSSIAHAPR